MALRRLLPKVLSSNVLITNLPVRQHVSEAVWNMPSAVRRCSSAARRPSFFRSSIVLAGTLGLGVYLGSNFVDPDQLKLAYLIPVRLGRDMYTAGAIIIDYKTSLRPDLSEEERKAVLKQCHQRGADRLLQLCFANGGIYTKLGQHIGQLDHLLPEEYVLTMRNNLLDRCPVSPISEVRRIITADLGAPPEQIFKHFNPNPIASASLAQVHVAEDEAGRKLAVKVQHAGLRESCAADIATVDFLVGVAKIVFPDFDYVWLVAEMRENVPRELDFTHEAANAERCRANLRTRLRLRHRVHIPHVYHDKTSPRVLTMEFIDGVPVTDLAALHRLRISTSRLSRLISECFTTMIFKFGDVHADPHAANMLVRRRHGRMQLVLLDHGLYRRIDDDFRLQYAGLWRALVFADVAAIEKHSVAMGAGDMVPLFAGMLTQRPWENVTSSDLDKLKVPTTQANKDMVQSYAQQYAKEIGQLLVKVPRELLLLLKTNDCLRSVDNNLGQPVNNIKVTARACTRALAEHRLKSTTGPWWHKMYAKAAVRWELFRLELQLAGLQVAVWLSMFSSGRAQPTPVVALDVDSAVLK